MTTAFIEQDCTVHHNGHSFTSGGAFVSPDYLIAYPAKDGVLNDWHGNPIGTWRTVSSRPARFFGYRSCWGERYFYMRGTVSGRTYALRGFGVGMIAKGKAVKS